MSHNLFMTHKSSGKFFLLRIFRTFLSLDFSPSKRTLSELIWRKMPCSALRTMATVVAKRMKRTDWSRDTLIVCWAWRRSMGRLWFVFEIPTVKLNGMGLGPTAQVNGMTLMMRSVLTKNFSWRLKIFHTLIANNLQYHLTFSWNSCLT